MQVWEMHFSRSIFDLQKGKPGVGYFTLLQCGRRPTSGADSLMCFATKSNKSPQPTLLQSLPEQLKNCTMGGLAATIVHHQGWRIE